MLTNDKFTGVRSGSQSDDEFRAILMFSLSGLTLCVFALGWWPACGEFLLR